MLTETQEHEEIIERIAALDIGKAELLCCIPVPGTGPSGRRWQEVSTHSTMTSSLLALADRLGVTRVVMQGNLR
jgi:transposase